MPLGSRLARELEAGRSGPLSSLLAQAWGEAAASRVARPLAVREGGKVVAVGGATLGGSGKTPLAVACAWRLAADGHGVVLVGHAYRARPGRCRVVSPGDAVDVVGDEALAAARALASVGARVVVGPDRQAALDYALELAPIAVLDGVAQLSPRRADLALLAVDAACPWGAGSCPPCGDLRAPREALLSACDRVVAIGEVDGRLAGGGAVVDLARVRSDGARLATRTVGWNELRASRVALWTTIARPERVLGHLSRQGVVPVVVVTLGDHAAPSRGDSSRAIERARRADVDLWLTTSKCATRIPPMGGVPVATLDYERSLGEPLVRALRQAGHGR